MFMTPEETGVTPVFGVPTTPSSRKYVEKDGKHMGVAGVGRDILGTLGDFLLTRLRMPAMYAPAQKQRRLEAAYEGFEQDPDSAIARVTDVDFNAGTKLAEQRTDNIRQATTAADVAEQRDARIAAERSKLGDIKRNRGASMIYTLTQKPPEKRAEMYSVIRDNIIKSGQKDGFDFSEELPETYQPEFLDSWVRSSVPVGTQLNLTLAEKKAEVAKEQGERRLEQGDRRIEQGDSRVVQGERRLEQSGANITADNDRDERKLAETERNNKWKRDNPTSRGGRRVPRSDAASAGPDKYIVNKVYKDANGNTATYLGNGKWK